MGESHPTLSIIGRFLVQLIFSSTYIVRKIDEGEERIMNSLYPILTVALMIAGGFCLWLALAHDLRFRKWKRSESPE